MKMGPEKGPFSRIAEKKQVRVFSLMKRLKLFYASLFNPR
jgi:hypothetical protein